MPTRYEYDLDHNGEWRWIAISEAGTTSAVSPVGYASLQNCMHAVGLMLAQGNVAVLPGPQAQRSPQGSDVPEGALSRLERRAPAA